MISHETQQSLVKLGERIRDARIAAGEPQKRFAVRLGVTIPTLRKLENGDPTVSLGTMAESLLMLNALGSLDSLLAPQDSLFARWEASQQPKSKPKRVSRKPRK